MIQKIIPTLWRFVQSPRLLFYVLVYFMGLLVIGTIAQKQIGLFSATHLFFNAFIYRLGPVPIPAGASVMGLLFINLTAHFITSSKWQRPYIGSTLAHLSIIVLLFGGGVTLWTKQEGFMVLRQNDVTQRMYDYHAREIVVYQNDKELFTLPANNLTENTTLRFARTLPFTVTLKTICKNCMLDDAHQLQPRPTNQEDEVNQWGMIFTIKKDAEDIDPVSVSEFSLPQKITSQGNTDYFIALRRQSRELPFSLRLENFTPRYYPGTAIAQSYESSLHVLETNNQKHDTSWPALISMNDPLRYQGYTFYQASFITLGNGETASVLNVVDNAGWLFPYLATFLLCAGLLIHLGVRRHAPQ